MKFKAVLFDLDGTLLDTLRDIADSVNAALTEMGFPTHLEDDYRYFVGEGREVLALKAMPENHRDKDTQTRLGVIIDKEYEERWPAHTHPYPGVPELLDGLTTKKLRLAILSNKPQDSAEVMVSWFLPSWEFEIILGAGPGIPRKPDPTAALQLAAAMKLKPRDFLYVGDSGIDMKTAVAAGMYPAGALWGFRTAEELKTAGAKVLLAYPTDVLKLLDD
jgi:phosphoglycolate phosphatase